MRKGISLVTKLVTVISLIALSGCRVNISSGGEAYQLSDYNVGRDNFDPQSPELSMRLILLDGGINIESANTVCKQILYLNQISESTPITIWINSTGGDMTTYLQISNTIKSTPAPVNIVNTGLCASAAVSLMQNATGKRYAFANSYFLLHACSGGAKDLRKMCNDHNEKLLREHTKIPEEWLPFRGEEYTLTAEEALKYGIIDEVIEDYEFFALKYSIKQKPAE